MRMPPKIRAFFMSSPACLNTEADLLSYGGCGQGGFKRFPRSSGSCNVHIKMSEKALAALKIAGRGYLLAASKAFPVA